MFLVLLLVFKWFFFEHTTRSLKERKKELKLFPEFARSKEPLIESAQSIN